MTATIRKATPADAGVITQYNICMARETEDLDLDNGLVHKGVAALLEDAAKGSYYVVEEAEQIVAQLMITYEWSDWRNANIWWIQSVYTHPEHRRKGLYSALFEHVKRAAQAQGAAGIRLYADEHNTRAQETYRKLGMTSHYRVFEYMSLSA